MTFLTETKALERAGAPGNDGQLLANVALAVEDAISPLHDHFDIFLSHSIRDAVLVLGVKRILEDAGKTVYVDWVVDIELDRNAINGETAERLRQRMRKCDACFYLHSRHSQHSRWMPWELGFFDGYNGNAAILPLLPPEGELDFTGEEYLEIYPKVDFTGLDVSRPAIFVNRSRRLETSGYKSFDEWKTAVDKLYPKPR